MITSEENRDFVSECPNGCGETVVEDTITDTFPTGRGTLMLVRDLPVHRCTVCGNIGIPSSSVELLEEMANRDPDETVELPAYQAKPA